MGTTESRPLTLTERICTPFAKALAFAICEPKLRLGRRRHDGICDRCQEPTGKYAMDKLSFPLEDLGPDASTSREKIRAMLDAEYVRVCLECGTELERAES